MHAKAGLSFSSMMQLSTALSSAVLVTTITSLRMLAWERAAKRMQFCWDGNELRINIAIIDDQMHI